jgi:hypothetical protein
MIPGPDLRYKCPDCGKIHLRSSLASGNTIGAVYYSDNRCIAPMLPEFPHITKCLQCKLIFWLDSSTKTEERDSLSRDYADFLTTDEYKEALSLGMGHDQTRETHLRMRLLWSWHEEMERGTLLPEDVYKDPAYEENIDALQKLINTNDTGGLLYFAELHRFAGRFEEAAHILEAHMENTEFNMIQESYRRCFTHDRRTYKLA